MRLIDGPFPRGRLVQVSRAPRLYVYEGFLDDDEMAHVKLVGDAVEQLEAVGLDVTHDSNGCTVDLPPFDDVFAALGARFESLIGRSDELDESVRFRRYQVGEQQKLHSDGAAPLGDLRLLVTALVCLDEPVAGGETVFPLASGGPIAVRHRPGRLVMWCNYRPDGDVEREAFHEGALVRAGTKATLAKFLHRPSAECGFAPAADIDLSRPSSSERETRRVPHTNRLAAG